MGMGENTNAPTVTTRKSTWTKERWLAVSATLDQALDIENIEARESFLISLAQRDQTLAAEVRALLSQHGDALDSPFFAGLNPSEFDAITGASLVGMTIGAYQLLEPIGVGGMGTVWLAKRADGRFEGRAAVKLLNLALVGKTSAERFRREGSILAKLAHQNIAHLVDAGVSQTGQPYLILEYIEGDCIDAYCRNKALPLKNRIKLFLDVLSGVSHAHSMLVVHRDIKPRNVLVDTTGEVKLLDFGIAKILRNDTVSQTPEQIASDDDLTRVAGNAYTPYYASPDQVKREAVGTASDVYSLGVLLYALLTDRLPYRVARQTAAAYEEAIIKGDVVAINHRDNKTTFNIDRDLEAIAAKAMQLAPADRYQSASSFRDDLERYLDGLPVRARGRSKAYLATRFVRRHWLPISLTTAAFVALSVGVWTIYNESEAQRITKTYLLETLTPTSYYNDGGGLLSQREMLLRAASGIEQRFSDRPKIAAELYESIGESLFNMGEHEDSFQVRTKAQPLIDQTFGASSRPAVRNAARSAYMHLTQRRFAEFQTAFDALRERCPLAVNGAPRDACYSLEWMQSMYRDHIGESRIAVARWKEADALIAPTIDAENRWHVLAGYWGAVAALDSGDVAQSKRFWLRLLANKDVQTNARGNHMYAIAASRLLNDCGFHEEAAALARRAYDQGTDYMGAAFDPRLFYIASVANPQSAVGKSIDVEPALRDSIYKPDARRTPQDTAGPRAALGLLLIANRQLDEARTELTEALRLFRSRSAKHSEHVMRIQMQLAALDALAGRRDEALNTVRGIAGASAREGDKGNLLRAYSLIATLSADRTESDAAWARALSLAEETGARPSDLRVLLRALRERFPNVRELPPPKDDEAIAGVRAYAQKVLDDTERVLKTNARGNRQKP
jgi:serine/threonine protein kinase